MLITNGGPVSQPTLTREMVSARLQYCAPDGGWTGKTGMTGYLREVFYRSAASTFADVIARNKGHTTGFDYLRIVLATGVVLQHSFIIAGQPYPIFPAQTLVLMAMILPAFFALSGYLVAGSLLRNSVPQFVALRALRIFPALTVEIFLCAFVLGTYFTALPLKQYFADPMFRSYMLNALGIVHLHLPGVFNGRVINAQLTTIPIELECYLALVLAGLCGLIHRRWLLLALVSLACVVMTIVAFNYPLITEGRTLSGRVLVSAFGFGTLVYYFRDRLPFHPVLFIVSLEMTFILLSYSKLSYLASPFVAYATVYIGMQKFRPIPFGDLSYGIYLFHFPVLQTIAYLSGHALNWVEMFLLTMVVTSVFAAGSWYLIEKPLLGSKGFVVAFIDRLTPDSARNWSVLNPRETPDLRKTAAMPGHAPDPGTGVFATGPTRL